MAERRYLPVITARGGSKGIPGKNIALLQGKPLIAYTIGAFKGSSLPGDCYVSTDSYDIAAISESFGAKVIYRPAEISDDDASSASAVFHVIDTLKEQGAFDYTDFILLQPTSPLRHTHHINEAVNLYESGEYGSVVSMTGVESHPYKYFMLEADGTAKPLYSSEHLATPRQNLPKVIKQNGAIYICSIDKFIRSRNFCEAPTMPYLMDEESSVDIDTPFDLEMVSFLMSR